MEVLNPGDLRIPSAQAPAQSLTESVGGGVLAAAAFKISPGVAKCRHVIVISKILSSLPLHWMGWRRENARMKVE